MKQKTCKVAKQVVTMLLCAGLIGGSLPMDVLAEEMQTMQRALQEKYKHKWEPICPEVGQNKLLWMIGEVGEVIDIVKKHGGANAAASSPPRISASVCVRTYCALPLKFVALEMTTMPNTLAAMQRLRSTISARRTKLPIAFQIPCILPPP